MSRHDTSDFIKHIPCPSCGSKDNNSLYTDGHEWCFGCNYRKPPHNSGGTSKGPSRVTGFTPQQGEYEDIDNRGISEKTCRSAGYLIGEHEGKKVHIANIRSRDGQLVGQKLRKSGKKFSTLGKVTESLFMAHMWRDGGKKLVITEGELDALSYHEVSPTWPVVSIPNGVDGALKAISANISWVEGFDEVIFAFDNDEVGQEAAKKCAAQLTPGKAKLAKLKAPYKDFSDALQAGDKAAITNAIWDAVEVRPDGIVSFGSIKERIKKPTVRGVPWPWQTLSDVTYGRHAGEVYGLGAGTGVGKTDVFTQIIHHDAVKQNIKCGVIYLEQPVEETGKRIAGKHVGRRFHIPDGSWTQEELDKAVDEIDATSNVHLYEAFGVMDWDVVKSRILYMIVALGCTHIFLDHLTALVAGMDGKTEQSELARILSDLSGIGQRYKVTFHYISHLATPEGTPHEEGGRVMIKHFKGSRSIGFWTHGMYGLERDQQSEDPLERSTTTFRVLKDRMGGTATGMTIKLHYEPTTGILSEVPFESGDIPL